MNKKKNKILKKMKLVYFAKTYFIKKKFVFFYLNL